MIDKIGFVKADMFRGDLAVPFKKILGSEHVRGNRIWGHITVLKKDLKGGQRFRMASFPVTLDGSCFMLCLLKINFENDNITDTIENEIVKLLIKYKKYIKIVYLSSVL